MPLFLELRVQFYKTLVVCAFDYNRMHRQLPQKTHNFGVFCGSVG